MALRAALLALLAFAAPAAVGSSALASLGARSVTTPPDEDVHLGARALLQGGAAALPQLGRPTATPRISAAEVAQAQPAPLHPATLGAASVGAVDRPTGVPRARPGEPS